MHLRGGGAGGAGQNKGTWAGASFTWREIFKVRFFTIPTWVEASSTWGELRLFYNVVGSSVYVVRPGGRVDNVVDSSVYVVRPGGVLDLPFFFCAT